MADTAETVKKTIDQTSAKTEKAQAAGAKVFRESMEKSVAGMSELNAHSKKNLEAMVESATAAQKGAEAISQQTLAYSRKSWEDGVAAAQSLTQARSVQEMVELQTAFAKTSVEAWLGAFNKTTELYTASVKDAFKPINERVTATVETFQAAR